MSEPKRPRGRPPRDKTMIRVGDPVLKLSTDAQRRQARGMSAAIHETCPVELFIEFQLAIMAGRNPILYRDENDVWHLDDDPNDKTPPSLTDKMNAVRFLSEYGFGKPVDNVKLTAEMKLATYSMNVYADDASMNVLSEDVERKILELLNPRLAIPGLVLDVLDVPSDDVHDGDPEDPNT